MCYFFQSYWSQSWYMTKLFPENNRVTLWIPRYVLYTAENTSFTKVHPISKKNYSWDWPHDVQLKFTALNETHHILYWVCIIFGAKVIFCFSWDFLLSKCGTPLTGLYTLDLKWSLKPHEFGRWLGDLNLGMGSGQKNHVLEASPGRVYHLSLLLLLLSALQKKWHKIFFHQGSLPCHPA